MKSKNSLIGLFLAISVFVLIVGEGFPGTESTVSPQIEKALLKEDWKAVVENVGPNEKLHNSPVLRAIKAHACLTLNRNNESLDLFVSIWSERDRQAWKKWATDFADKKYSSNAASFYLKGDALARLQEWRPALEAFNQALSLKKDWYLALNARGVVHHAIGNVKEARRDFEKATTSKNDFADAYANRGTLNIYGRSVRGAKDSFEKAKEYSSDSLLVLNGLGCAFYGEQNYKEARKYFDAIPSGSVISKLAGGNAFAAEMGRLARALKRASDSGMSVKAFELEFGGYPFYVFSGRDSGDKPIHKIPDGKGGYYIIDDEGFIIDHIPGPDTGEGEGGEKGKAGEKDKEQGSYQADIIIIGPHGPEIYPGPWTLPVIPPYVTDQLAALSIKIEKSTATMPAMAGKAEVSGVDGRPVKHLRTSRVRWNVFTVYGLLYNVPLASSHGQPTKATKTAQ